MFEHGFPSHWTFLDKLIWLVGAGIAGASYIWKTVTGTLIHITDALASPMQKCEVTLEPIQDLHGYDNPWSDSKNKMPPGEKATKEKNGLTIASNAGVYTITGNASTTTIIKFDLIEPFTIPSDSTHNFLIGNSAAPSGSDLIRFYNGSTLIDYYSFTSVNRKCTSFSDIANKYCTAIEIQCASGARNYTVSPMFCLKSESDDFVAGGNICPITGWTGCNVYVTNKNIVDTEHITYTDNYCVTSDGELSYSTNYKATDFLPIPSDTDIVIHGVGQNANPIRTAFYSDASESTLISVEKQENNYFTCHTPSNAHYMRSSVRKPSTDPFWVEVGSVASETYPTHQGTTASVTFPDSAGTVYGGTLDVVTGELVADRAIIDLSTLNWLYTSASQLFRASITGMRLKGIICSSYKSSTTARVESLEDKEIWNNGYAFDPINVVIKDTAYTDASIFKASLNGVSAVYYLATPLTYQLTPQEISTLKGENNIWADVNGEITLIYKAQSS